MVVVRRGHKNHIEILAVVLKHLAPVGVALGFLPAFLAMNSTPAALVHFGEGDALETETVRLGGVRLGAATDGDEYRRILGNIDAFIASSGRGAADGPHGQPVVGTVAVGPLEGSDE